MAGLDDGWLRQRIGANEGWMGVGMEAGKRQPLLLCCDAPRVPG